MPESDAAACRTTAVWSGVGFRDCSWYDERRVFSLVHMRPRDRLGVPVREPAPVVAEHAVFLAPNPDEESVAVAEEGHAAGVG